jgi:hypothetical protein
MQTELNFDDPPTPIGDGRSLWHRQREEQQLALAKKLGLPIGQNVEVWLRGGVRLRGRLQFHEEALIQSIEDQNSKFAVDGVPFQVRDLESCIRI